MDDDDRVRLADVPSIADERWASQNGTPTIPQPFAGLTHAEVLALEFPPERMLIDDLIPIGAVGTIAGVPETYKSWQAQAIANIIATGQGDVFGHHATHTGPVGYFWQDDSTREEAERIKLYHRIRGNGNENVPIRWFLNEGLQLPDHAARLRTTITTHGFVLIVLDSFYNVLFGHDLKDAEAEQVISELKTLICDTTGCTILIVDHMPWATEQNRKRLRAYGGVFKGAAIRFGIYLDAVGESLYVEARGNNIAGFKRQTVAWNSEALELQLVEATPGVHPEEYEKRVIDYLENHYGATTDEVDRKAGGDTSQIKAARLRLEINNQVSRFKKPGSRADHWMAQPSENNQVPIPETQINPDEPGFQVSRLPLRGGQPETQLEPPNPPGDGIPF